MSKRDTLATLADPDQGHVDRDGGRGGRSPKSSFAKEIGASKRKLAAADLRRLVSPVRPAYPDHEAFAIDPPWVQIDSRVLGERIVLVLRPDRVREAEESFPEAVAYVVPEMEILSDYVERPDVIRRLHAIKKEMRGWLFRPKA